jgi:three-Cys-motif partner protein
MEADATAYFSMRHEETGEQVMGNQEFFEEPVEPSRIKAQIVVKYFRAWSRIMLSVQRKQKPSGGYRIAYIDLMAGVGRYDDGTPSTPLLLLEHAVSDKDMSASLMTVFNDKTRTSADRLQAEIDSLPGVDTLRFKPQVYSTEVREELARLFEEKKLIPTLCFIDPWGYVGITLRLLSSILKDWGSECIFFFNFNRINAALSNPLSDQNMSALFGSARAQRLQNALSDRCPSEREATVIEELCQSLKEIGGTFVLPFCFKDEHGTRTSHHIVFVSKHEKGYEIMKDIMAKYSTDADQGVPSFRYNPATKRQPLLFELSRPLDELEDLLLEDFAGKTISIDDLYKRHNVGRPYIRHNYKDAIAVLLRCGKVRVVSKSKRHRTELTYNDEVIFPPTGV